MDLFSKQYNRLFYLISFVIIVAYACIQVSYFLEIPEPRLFPDSNRYLKLTTSSGNEFNPNEGVTTPLMPLIYKLLGKNLKIIAYAQLFVSICSWTFLGFAIARSLKSIWLMPLVYITILTLSLSDIISLWNSTILSESFSLSFFACFIGAWIIIVPKISLKRFLALIAISILFGFLRSINAYIVLMIGGIIAMIGYINQKGKGRHYYILLQIVFIVVFIMSNKFSDSGNHWTSYTLNVFSTRILPNQEYRAYFEKHGMPVNENLLARTGKIYYEDDFAYYKDPKLEQFRNWLYLHGKSTYLRYLLTHPRYLLLKPLHDLQDMLFSSRLIYYAPKGFILSPPGKLFDAVSAWGLYPAYIFFTGILVGLNIVFTLSKKSTASWVPLIMIFLVYPLAAIIWHGDSHEIDRHVLPVVVQARLGFVLLLLLTIDTIISESHLCSMRENKY